MYLRDYMFKRGILIPSVRVTDGGQLPRLAKYFSEVELNLGRVRQPMDRDQNALLTTFGTRLKEVGMSVYSVHLPQFDLSGDNVATVESAVNFCNIIHTLFSPKLAVIHPGKGQLSSLVSNLALLFERIPPELAIVVENMTSGKAVLCSPITIKNFIQKTEQLPPNLGICIDTTHPAFTSAKTDSDSYTSLVLAYMDASLPKLKHLHFSDRSRGNGPGKHLPLGQGFVNWQKIDEFLGKVNYGGKATLEIGLSDRDAEKTIASANHYGRLQSDLKTREEGNPMPKPVEITSEEMLAKISKLPSMSPLPPSLLALLNLRKSGICEESEDFIYLVVPSDAYKARHADPYDLVIGEVDDAVAWADYVFGVRYHGLYLSAVLIDKVRKIAVEDVILGAYGDYQGKNWVAFEKAVKEALQSADNLAANKPLASSIQFDHINLSSIANIEYISSRTKRAWK